MSCFCDSYRYHTPFLYRDHDVGTFLLAAVRGTDDREYVLQRCCLASGVWEDIDIPCQSACQPRILKIGACYFLFATVYDRGYSIRAYRMNGATTELYKHLVTDGDVLGSCVSVPGGVSVFCIPTAGGIGASRSVTRLDLDSGLNLVSKMTVSLDGAVDLPGAGWGYVSPSVHPMHGTGPRYAMFLSARRPRYDPPYAVCGKVGPVQHEVVSLIFSSDDLHAWTFAGRLEDFVDCAEHAAPVLCDLYKPFLYRGNIVAVYKDLHGDCFINSTPFYSSQCSRSWPDYVQRERLPF